MEQYSYPTTRYQPPTIPDHSSIAVRRQLSGPSLRRFFGIMRRWRVGTADARLLLGAISSRRYRQLAARPEGRILNQDQLLRVTSVISLDQSLRKLLGRRQANKWALTADWRLRGGTPLFNLIHGGPVILRQWSLALQKQAGEQQMNEGRQ